MSEYEIFNDETEVVPEQNKKEKRKIESENKNLVKKIFSLTHISLFLSVISLLFSFLVAFLPLVSQTMETINAIAALFFFAFFIGLTGLIIEIFNPAKTKQTVPLLHLVLSILSIVVSIFCVVGLF